MADDYLFCNYKNCKNPITKFTWVTRCSHVFCESHGNSFFSNKSSKVKCPVCNEINTMESDIVRTDLNPHDVCIFEEKKYFFILYLYIQIEVHLLVETYSLLNTSLQIDLSNYTKN